MDFGIDKYIADAVSGIINNDSIKASKEFAKYMEQTLYLPPTLQTHIGRIEMTFMLDSVYSDYIHLSFENIDRVHYTIRKGADRMSGVSSVSSVMAYMNQGAKITAGSKYEW